MKKALFSLVGLGVVVSGLYGALAFDPEEPDVVVARHQTMGQYLTDVRGLTLYVNTNDSKNTSTCFDQCIQTWPPTVFKDKSKPLVGEGADDKLIDFIKRKDGIFQVTYGGFPLYSYAKDQKPGEFGGQGVGNSWYVINPRGEIVKVKAQAQPSQVAQAPQTQQVQEAVQRPQTQQAQQNQQTQQAQPTPAQAQAIAQGVKDGEPLYVKFCVGCHGDKGQGGVGSKLDGLAALKDKPGMISQVLGGGQQMPAFGSSLSDKEAAALMTYIMNSWSNKHGLVTEAEVKARR